MEVFLQSTKLGLITSLACMFLSTFWILTIGAIEEVYGKPNLSSYFEKLLLYISLSLIIIHPAIITVILFGLWDISWFDTYVLSIVNIKEIGLIYLALVLFIPFSFLFMKGIKVNHYFYLWKKAYVLQEASPLISFFSIVLLPIILRSIPFFLFLVIAIEGIVFIPYMHQGTKAVTAGKVIYTAIVSESTSEKLATLLIYLMFLKLAAIVFLVWVMGKYKKEIINKELLFTTNFHLESSTSNYSRSLKLKLICLLFFLSVLPFVGAVSLILFKLILSAKWLIFNESLSVYEALNYSPINSTTVMQATVNTLWIAFVSALIVSFLFYFFSYLVGKMDQWVPESRTKLLVESGSFFAVIPISIFCYLSSRFFEIYPIVSIVIFMSIFGLSYSFFSTRYEVIGKLFKLERKRISLDINKYPYWKTFYPLILKDLLIMFLWVFSLLWNDIVIQLFAQTKFQGIANFLLAVGRDGLSKSQAGAISIVQLLFILLALLIILKVERRLYFIRG